MALIEPITCIASKFCSPHQVSKTPYSGGESGFEDVPISWKMPARVKLAFLATGTILDHAHHRMNHHAKA